MRRTWIAVAALGFTALARAESPDAAAPGAGDLRQALQEYFQARLRVELGLTDEQVGRIAPRVAELVRARAEARRQRERAMRDLADGLGRGATDAELGQLLERAERIETERIALETRILGDIDGGLTVRQRAELRLFVERFRRELRGKVAELRGGGRRPPGGRRWLP